MLSNREIVIRMAISLLVGIIIGYERSLQHKSAGVRTYSLVCIGSTVFMLVSAYGVIGPSNLPGFRMDPGRIAAQIIVGIGFLGAGVIMKEKGHITGLTTAAELWVTAGLGMVIGLGWYFLTIIGVASIFIALYSTSFLAKLHLLPCREDIEPDIKPRRENCSR